MSENNLYNLSGLMEFVEDDKEQIVFLVSIFLEDVPEMLKDLNQAHRSGDLEKMKFFSHKLKSSVDLFKVDTIHTEIRSIEQYAKSGISLVQIDPLIEKTNTVLETVMDGLRKEFSL
ncbi:MAG: Hpt domain-containing protein [Bacteroidota bacterium]|nr:Hpt domain-containing protein [Bacteroidota bacterium]